MKKYKVKYYHYSAYIEETINEQGLENLRSNPDVDIISVKEVTDDIN